MTDGAFLYVVELQPKAVGSDIAAKVAALDAGSVDDGVPLLPLGGNRYVVPMAVAYRLERRLDDPVQATLAKIDGVSRVRRLPGAQVRSLLSTSDHESVSRGPISASTADPRWHYGVVDADGALGALDQERRRPGSKAVPLSSIRIAQLDTGFHPHEAFSRSAVAVDRGRNYVDAGRVEPIDPFWTEYLGQPGHGTRIGSVIAADVAGRTGVAPGATLIPYRITNSVVIDFAGNPTAFPTALRHAMDENGVHVVNVSLGDPCFPNVESGRAVDEAYERGVIVVAAAGNIKRDVTYPGRYHRVVTVGGVGPRDRPWAGGSRGEWVDLCAPAVDISRATWKRKERSRKSPSVDNWIPVYDNADADGTSYAAAHVSGAAALWLAFHGSEIDRLYGRDWRRTEAFRHCARASARAPDGWNTDDLGAGILQIARLLAERLPDPATLRRDDRKAADARF